MSRLRLWAAIAAVGFTLLAVSVLMALLSAHHWYLGYESSLLLEAWCWWVQAGGIVLSIVGGIGLLASLTPRAALRAGAALITTGLVLCVAFGTSILEIHDWGTVLSQESLSSSP